MYRRVHQRSQQIVDYRRSQTSHRDLLTVVGVQTYLTVFSRDFQYTEMVVVQEQEAALNLGLPIHSGAVRSLQDSRLDGAVQLLEHSPYLVL